MHALVVNLDRGAVTTGGTKVKAGAKGSVIDLALCKDLAV